MTFYKIAIFLIKVIFRLFNGKTKVVGLENIPTNQPVIFAATHRSMTDPFFIAKEVYPKKVAFMAKDSLFKNPILNTLLRAGFVFPVNRDKPSTAAIKHAVQVLTKDDLNLGIFPSGSRHTTEVKGGTAFIQKLSKVSIVPVAIQPPIGFWQFIARKKAKLAFGEPITFQAGVQYTKEKLTQVDAEIVEQFQQLDQVLDSNYVYVPKKKK